MKILHIADTHLGYSAYRKVTEDGVNQREQDTFDAFKQFIDYAVETKPDLVLHAGDLFDSVRPTNRAITCALQQTLRLSKQKIPFVVIAGNHEHPKLRETGHIFSIFDHIEHVYPVYHASYETITFTIKNKKIVIHALPQCLTNNDFSEQVKKLKPDPQAAYNILITHGIVKGIKELGMYEFNESVIPTETLTSQFDYIALGHYHKYLKVQENAYYPGSPERFSFAEAGEQKGFITLDVKRILTPTFYPLKTRPMVDAQPVDCTQLSLDEVMNKIKKIIREIDPDGKIFRIILDHIPSHIARGIDYHLIRDLSRGALHSEIKTNVLNDENTQSSSSSTIGSLIQEFEMFLRAQSLVEKEKLLKLGVEYLEKIEEKTVEQ